MGGQEQALPYSSSSPGQLWELKFSVPALAPSAGLCSRNRMTTSHQKAKAQNEAKKQNGAIRSFTPVYPGVLPILARPRWGWGAARFVNQKGSEGLAVGPAPLFIHWITLGGLFHCPSDIHRNGMTAGQRR